MVKTSGISKLQINFAMQYDLSPNDRYFLNQVIPKWETGQPFDLNADMKYVFQREMGSKYNAAVFELTLENVRSFLSDHGLAKERPAHKYTFSLLPKGNMLRVLGSIELFEAHLEQERQNGKAIHIPGSDKNIAHIKFSTPVVPQKKSRSKGLFLISILVIIVLSIVIWLLFAR